MTAPPLGTWPHLRMSVTAGTEVQWHPEDREAAVSQCSAFPKGSSVSGCPQCRAGRPRPVRTSSPPSSLDGALRGSGQWELWNQRGPMGGLCRCSVLTGPSEHAVLERSSRTGTRLPSGGRQQLHLRQHSRGGSGPADPDHADYPRTSHRPALRATCARTAATGVGVVQSQCHTQAAAGLPGPSDPSLLHL